MDSDLTIPEYERYSRHLLLPEVGIAGQQRLKAASVLIVGMGGLGNPVALYLAAAGVGHLGLMDDDTIDPSNLQRQVLFEERAIGQQKAAEAARRIQSQNPHVNTTVYPVQATGDSLREVTERYDLVVDGTDNFTTRYVLNDWCVASSIPLVYASISQFEGQASVFATPDGPCYRCLFPEPPPAHLVPNCAEGGVLGVLPGLLGVIQATEALKLLLGIGESLAGRLLLVDALGMRFRALSIARDPACPSCGSARKERYQAVVEHEPPDPRRPERGVADVRALLAAEPPVILLDVRSGAERAIDSLGGLHVPLAEIPRRLDEIKDVSSEAQIVVYCQSGVRSAVAVDLLEQAGVQAVSLRGGLNAWRNEAAAETVSNA